MANAAGSFSSTLCLDCEDRISQVRGSGGVRETRHYDAAGNLTAVVDAQNQQTSYLYDGANRVRQVTAADGGVTLLEYDAEGNLWKVRDPRQRETVYTYDGFGHLRSLSSPDSGLTQYSVDAFGRVTAETLANSKHISYVWDAEDRLVSRTAGGVTESFSYDAGSHGKGRLTGMSDASGSAKLSYNAAGGHRGR